MCINKAEFRVKEGNTIDKIKTMMRAYTERKQGRLCGDEEAFKPDLKVVLDM